MPIFDLIKWRFTKENAAKAPDEPGVYALIDGKEIIYYGRADTSIRMQLQRHLAGKEAPGTQKATHYRRECTANHVVRERQLLDEYEMQNGQRPRCNF